MVIAPFFVMPTVSALVWKNLLMHPVSGLFAWIATLVGYDADRLVQTMPLARGDPDRGLAMAAVCHPHLADGAGSRRTRNRRKAAEMDGASALSSFIYLTLPHLARPITVVILIETIFLLTVFAEIFVTTGVRPRPADHQHRLPDLLAGADPV